MAITNNIDDERRPKILFSSFLSLYLSLSLALKVWPTTNLSIRQRVVLSGQFDRIALPHRVLHVSVLICARTKDVQNRVVLVGQKDVATEMKRSKYLPLSLTLSLSLSLSLSSKLTSRLQAEGETQYVEGTKQ